MQGRTGAAVFLVHVPPGTHTGVALLQFRCVTGNTLRLKKPRWQAELSRHLFAYPICQTGDFLTLKFSARTEAKGVKKLRAPDGHTLTQAQHRMHFSASSP